MAVLSLALSAATAVMVCFPSRASAQQPRSDEEFEAQLQLFFEQLEEQMKDWPCEDISEELPLDDKVHTRIVQIGDRVRIATLEKVRSGSWPDADVQLRSISYVMSSSEKTIEVSYTGASDTKVPNSRTFWHDVHLRFRDGNLGYMEWFTHRFPMVDNVLGPIVERQAKSVLESAAHQSPLSWPVSADTHEILTAEMNRVLALCVEALKDSLEGAADVTGRIEAIEYIFQFDEKQAKIEVTFDIDGTADEFFCPEIVLDYKQGRFRLQDLIHPGWTGGAEYVGNAWSTAADQAIAKWVSTFNEQTLFQDARVWPPFEWQEAAQDLPGGLGRVVHLMRRSHPFLGEHYRSYRLELSDGTVKTFVFPHDGGSVSRTDVYLLDEGEKRFIHFQDDERTMITIALDTLKICPSKRRPAADPVLTFRE